MRRLLVTAITTTVTATLLLLAAPGAANAQEDMIYLSDCEMMTEGDSGPCVAVLQYALNETGAPYGLTTDGQFGAATRIALLDFQGRNRLPADGRAGNQVIVALIGQVGDANILDVEGDVVDSSDDTAPAASAITCTPNVAMGPPSASIPPDLQAYFRCSGGNSTTGSSQRTTATEVTCTPGVALGPPSASIPPDLQRNFDCYPTGGGGELSADCALDLLSGALGLDQNLMKLTSAGKFLFKKVPIAGWILAGSDAIKVADSCFS